MDPLSEARDLSKRATELDSAGAYTEALRCYKEACDRLLVVMEREKDATRRVSLSRGVEQYVSRIRVLEAHVGAARAAVEDLPSVPSGVPGPRQPSEVALEEARAATASAMEADRRAGGASVGVPTTAELAALGAAYRHYKRAAELYVRALELLEKEEEKGAEGGGEGGGGGGGGGGGEKVAGVRRLAGGVLERAEVLHRRIQVCGGIGKGVGLPGEAGKLGFPSLRSGVKRSLHASEIAVLRRTSLINGKIYLPFLPQDSLAPHPATRPFEDPDGLPALSTRQQDRLGSWVRASSLSKSPCVIRAINPLSVTQALVPDCSFIASLIICANHAVRHSSTLLQSALFPKHPSSGNPVLSPGGKYMVRLHLNGHARKVVVDDRIPVDASRQPLCSFSVDASELWVSLLEKAFLKVCGSYAFPGSNSAKDLHALTGWIPEVLRPQEEGFAAESVWRRLESAWRFGDVLLGCATPSSAPEAERLGLVQGHAYAILDLKTVPATHSPTSKPLHMLLIKNPWGRQRWTGPFGPEDETRWTPRLRAALGGYDPAAQVARDNGVFWMQWEHVQRFFSSLYCNWRPQLFPHALTLHGAWPVDAPGPRNDQYDIGENPQFLLSVNNGASTNPSAPLWILLEKHVTKIDPDDEADPEISVAGTTLGGAGAGDGKDKDEEQVYVAVHVFGDKASIEEASVAREGRGREGRSGGGGLTSPGAGGGGEGGEGGGGGGGGGGGRGAKRDRVHFASEALIRGHYYGSQFVLTRFNVTGGSHSFVLALSQFERKHSLDYTIKVFSTASLALEPLQDRFRYTAEAKGAWEAAKGTFGGRGSHVGYYENPQYRLSVRGRGALKLSLKHPKAVFGGVRVYGPVPDSTSRLDGGHGFPLVVDSGPYRSVFATNTIESFPEGVYVAIVSPFDPASPSTPEKAPFRFTASHSTTPVSLTPLPNRTQRYNFGKVIEVVGEWRGTTAAGCPTHGRYRANPSFAVHLPKPCIVQFLLIPAHSAHPPSTNLSLFPSPLPEDASPRTAMLTTNRGVYSNVPQGLATPIINLETGHYTLVPSTYEKDLEHRFKVVMRVGEKWDTGVAATMVRA